MNQIWIKPYLGGYLMTKSNIDKPLAQDPSSALHAGVDLALEKNVVVVVNEKGERLDHFGFPQDRGGYDYFLQRLEGLRQKHQAAKVVVAMEPTNYFWKLLARELEEKQQAYRLVNAYTVKKHREGDQLDRSKDDRRDAAQIAELSRNGKTTQTQLQKGAYEDLRQYTTLYHQLMQSIRREKIILWGLVGQVFPEMVRAFKDLEGETYQALLMTCPAAAAIRQMSLDAFLAQVRAAYSGKRLCVSKLKRVYQLANSSIGLTDGLQAIKLAIQVHLTQLQVFETQLKQVTAAMTARLRDVTYETVLLKLRKVYHRQVAQWLESTAGERISEYLSLIARHYELAGETAKAVVFLRRLGEESFQVSAFRDAVRAYERVLALLPAVDLDRVQGASAALPETDLAERAMLLITLGNLYNRVGDSLIGIEHLEQGLALARQANDPQAEIAALNRLAQIASERGTFDKAQSYLDEVLALAREQEDLTCIASTLSMLGSIAWKWGDLEEAEKFCHESLAIYRELDNRKRISKLLNILGILATLQENYEQAEQYYERGLRMAREIDNRLLVADILNNLGYLNHHNLQNLKKAKRCYQESLLIANEIDHRSGATSTLINLGQLNILLGEHQVALKYLREALIETVAIGAVPLTLDALVGVAQQQIEVEQYASAAEILGLVLSHPALEIDVSQVAASVLGRLREVMPAKQLEAAMERGKIMELDEVVADLDVMVAEILGDPDT
jgi:tetratricopeptide (TPR) repeat protein